MSNSTERREDWEQCQGGELRQVAREGRIARRNKELVRFSSAVVMVLVLVSAVTVIARRFNGLEDHRYGGITCEETKLHLAEFAAGALDATLSRHIQEHLADCGPCGRLYEQMRTSAGEPTAAAPIPGPTTAAVVFSFPTH